MTEATQRLVTLRNVPARPSNQRVLETVSFFVSKCSFSLAGVDGYVYDAKLLYLLLQLCHQKVLQSLLKLCRQLALHATLNSVRIHELQDTSCDKSGRLQKFAGYRLQASITNTWDAAVICLKTHMYDSSSL